MCSKITATGKLNGKEIGQIEVINPGDWFGKCWLIEIGGSYWPLFLVVEADSLTDTIDELADSEKHKHHIVVPDEDLGDHDPEQCYYSGSGAVLDLDHLMIHGQEGSDCPFPCTYHGDDLPAEGVKPSEFWQREEANP